MTWASVSFDHKCPSEGDFWLWYSESMSEPELCYCTGVKKLSISTSTFTGVKTLSISTSTFTGVKKLSISTSTFTRVCFYSSIWTSTGGEDVWILPLFVVEGCRSTKCSTDSESWKTQRKHNLVMCTVLYYFTGVKKLSISMSTFTRVWKLCHSVSLNQTAECESGDETEQEAVWWSNLLTTSTFAPTWKQTHGI